MKKYTELEVLKDARTGRFYKTNPIYPRIPLTADDFYIITSIGDRYDTLAKQFYNDSSLWWIIASANNFEKASLTVTPGVQLRIPIDIQNAIEIFNSGNKQR
jgi:hypothetical protein